MWSRAGLQGTKFKNRVEPMGKKDLVDVEEKHVDQSCTDE